MQQRQSIPFDRAVEYYDETRGFPPGVERDVAALIAGVGGLDGSGRVLEIGVGTGRIALPLSQHAGAVFGLDLSRPMMERLRRKQQHEAVYLAQGDALHLPYPAAAFDVAMAVHVFHLIPEWRAAVEELRRILQPGGRLVSAWGGMRYGDLWGELRGRVGAVEHVGMRTQEEFDAHLLSQGWRKLGEGEHAYLHTITPRRLVRQIRERMHSWTWRATDEQISAAADALTDMLRERYGDLNQRIEVTGTYGAAAFALPE